MFGEFKRGAYKVKIDGGATSVDGGVLLAPFAYSFSVAARKPQLQFAASGRYLPRSAWNNLGIKHLNVDAVNLVVRSVPPALLAGPCCELECGCHRQRATLSARLRRRPWLRSAP